MIPAMVRWFPNPTEPNQMLAGPHDDKRGVIAPNLPIVGYRLLRAVELGWICQIPMPKQYPDRVTAEVFVPAGVIQDALTLGIAVRGAVSTPLVWHATPSGHLLGIASAYRTPTAAPKAQVGGWSPSLFELPWAEAKSKAEEQFRQAFWRRLCAKAPTKRDLARLAGHADRAKLMAQLKRWGLADALPPNGSRKRGGAPRKMG